MCIYIHDVYNLFLACPDCYQDIEDSYTESLTILNQAEEEIQSLTSATSNLTPFEQRVLQYQNNISDLQANASALVARQRELLVFYEEVLFAINETLRDRLTQINQSLDTLKLSFTAAYVITFTSQELMTNILSEFQMALNLVAHIELVCVPSIMQNSAAVQSNAMDVNAAARELESTRRNFSEQVEELRNATYEILTLSASILRIANQLVQVQEGLVLRVENITSTYGSLGTEIEGIRLALSVFEMNLVTITSRLRLKSESLVQIPESDVIIYLTRNASETESFVRNDVLNEIMDQSRKFSALNETYTAQRLEFEDIFQEVSRIGLNVSALLALVRESYEEAVSVSSSTQSLFATAETVASNLESFNNETFSIGSQVAAAMGDIDAINSNASMALSEARNLEDSLRNFSANLEVAKEVAFDALNATNTSFQVCTYLYMS